MARMRPYVVRQGDYLTRLAAQHGFDADEVWSHGRNSELRQRRSSYEVLLPGDVVYLPTAPPTGLQLDQGTTNSYTATVPTVRIRIALRTQDSAIAGEPYVVEGLRAPFEARTDQDGTAEFDVPVTVREVRLTVPAQHLSFPVLIGHLDPCTEPSGVRMRLSHLGYEAADFRSDEAALLAFQRATGLAPTGILDDATQAALSAAHRS